MNCLIQKMMTMAMMEEQGLRLVTGVAMIDEWSFVIKTVGLEGKSDIS
jgi:hypothetical protein